MQRRCLDCPRRITTGSRCAEHQRQRERAKRARRPERHTYAAIQRNREAVAAHVAVHGWWCLGDEQHNRHPTRDLTASHVVAVGAGGPELGPVAVECRPANSRRGARPLGGHR